MAATNAGGYSALGVSSFEAQRLAVLSEILNILSPTATDANSLLAGGMSYQSPGTGLGQVAELQLLKLISTELSSLANAPKTGYVASGIATLVGGQVTVNTPFASATNVIELTYYSSDGSYSGLTYTQIVEGVSFHVRSTWNLDTNQVAWAIFKP